MFKYLGRGPVNRWEYENAESLGLHPRGEMLFVVVKTKIAKYFGQPWCELSDYRKHKWENMLVIAFPRDRLKIVYQ